MAATDNPLKRLVSSFIEDFASWILGVEVLEVISRNIELPPEPDSVLTDQVFLVKLVDKRYVVLHIEFQGRRTRKPMPWRELDYMSRLAQTYRDVELYSVVFYVGRGAGRHDKGVHKVNNPKGGVSLYWQYQVIRLSEMSVEELLVLGVVA